MAESKPKFTSDTGSIAAPTAVTGGERAGQQQGLANKMAGEASAQATKFLGTQIWEATKGYSEAGAAEEIAAIADMGTSDKGTMGTGAAKALAKAVQPFGEMSPEDFMAAAQGKQYHPSETKVRNEIEIQRALEREGVMSPDMTNARIQNVIKKYSAQWPGLSAKFRQIAADESEKALYGDQQVYNMWIDDASRKQAAKKEKDYDDAYKQWVIDRDLPFDSNTRAEWVSMKRGEDAAKQSTDNLTAMQKNGTIDSIGANQNLATAFNFGRKQYTNDAMVLLRGAFKADGSQDLELINQASATIKGGMEQTRAAELNAVRSNKNAYGADIEAYNKAIADVNAYWDAETARLKNPMELSKWHQSNLFAQENKARLETNAALAGGIQGRLAMLSPETSTSFRTHFNKVFEVMDIKVPAEGHQVPAEDREKIKKYFAGAKDPLMTSAMFLNILDQGVEGDSTIRKQNEARAREAFTKKETAQLDIPKLKEAYKYGNPEAAVMAKHLYELVGTVDTGFNRKPNGEQIAAIELFTGSIADAHGEGKLPSTIGAARCNQILNVTKMMPEDAAMLSTSQMTNDVTSILFDSAKHNGVVNVLTQKSTNEMAKRFPIQVLNGKLVMQPYQVVDDMGQTIEYQKPPAELTKALETANSYLPVFQRLAKDSPQYKGVDGVNAIASAWNSGDMATSGVNNLVQTQQQISYTVPKNTPAPTREPAISDDENRDIEVMKSALTALRAGASVEDVATLTRKPVNEIKSFWDANKGGV